MKVDGKAYRSIWLADDGWSVQVIDQTLLPHSFEIRTLRTVDEAAEAIATMVVRGAPLIGATAAYGLALALRVDPSDEALEKADAKLLATRPTAVNLRWALRDVRWRIDSLPDKQRAEAANLRAAEICDEDVAICEAIGKNGVTLIRDVWKKKKEEGRVKILTHCNAGWLATVDWGTALAPIYMAHDEGIPVHVWVDETRPRNQGANLTAWELGQHGVPHSLIVDNAGGHLMQHNEVDLCFVGTDRTTGDGDVCNKIGTYLKALAACDNDVPFYVCAPSPSIDWTLQDGLRDIPIEQRDPREVTHLRGMSNQQELTEILLTAADSSAVNYAFDVTPARLVTGLVTERGICEASRQGLNRLFGDLVEQRRLL